MQPVIGIVTQPLSSSLMKDPQMADKTSYIMKAYVDWVESAGARVVPLIMTDDNAVTDEKLSKINGVLFPGGSGNYRDIGDYIYNKLVAENDSGNFYPLWGTCLGFENLARFASDSGNPLSNQASKDESLTLTFLEDPSSTKMFSDATDPDYYTKEGMTFNHHMYGLSTDVFVEDKGLAAMFKPTSTSIGTVSGDTFVASMESPDYPFFGTQFHPEKILDMYNNGSIDHSWKSVNYNRYFADRFVEMARQNTNTCGDWSTCSVMEIDENPVYVTNTYYGNVYAW